MTQLNRRDFLAALGTAAALLGTGARVEPKRKPNIVFFLADDLGRHQLRCYGNTFYETPNIDRLAAQGMKFSNAYSACPVCSPTRASIMTGKYPARLHLTDYIPGCTYPHAKLTMPDWTKILPLGEVTLAEMLGKAGYVCGHFGKWHLSRENDVRYVPGETGTPETQGFDEVFVAAKPESDEAAKAGADPKYDAHHAIEISDRAMAFMKANKDKPFFCHMGHNLIHKPEMEFAPAIIKYARKPEASNAMGNNPVLGAMVETLDTQVGRVLKALDDLGIADNTIVVFFSDNGDYYGGEERKPLFGGKADLYEGGIRMPLIVRWPGVAAQGSESDAIMSSIDFMPTFAAVAGQKIADTAVDGTSILPALRQSGTIDRDAIYWHYPHYHPISAGPSAAIRRGRYKLIEWFEKSIDGPKTPGALELFDLESDPGERNNLAETMPDLAAEMYAKLIAWRKSVNAQEMTRNPDYDPKHAGDIK